MVARFSSEGAENLIGSLKGRLDSLKSRFYQAILRKLLML
jgi:hypothetical protein